MNSIFFLALVTLSLISFVCLKCVYLVFVIGVLVFGLPHGALDIWVLRKMSRQKWFNVTLFFIAYLLLAGFILLGFIYNPILFFIVFLCYSAFHFGMDYYSNNRSTLYAFLCGSAIICFPSLLYVKQVCTLFSPIIGLGHATILSNHLHYLAMLLFVLIVFFVVPKASTDRIELILLFVGAIAAPPLAFLTVYFITVHSSKHFLMLYRNFHYQSVSSFILDLLPMTLLSYVFASIIYWLLPDAMNWQSKGFATIIYLLAALTFPHLMLVEWLHARISFINAIRLSSDKKK